MERKIHVSNQKYPPVLRIDLTILVSDGQNSYIKSVYATWNKIDRILMLIFLREQLKSFNWM